MWSLIGKIGVNGQPFEVGTSLTMSAPYSGELYLDVNDCYYGDNTGSWIANISVSACTIAATTLAHVPGTNDSERALTGRIGVGEQIALELSNGDTATWTISSGHGLLEQSTPAATGCSGSAASSSVIGKQACFTAPYSNDSTTITANEGVVSCSVPLTIVQPTGLIFQRLEAPGYGFVTILAPNYLYGASMWNATFVTPGDVSFANIRIAEEDISRPYSVAIRNVVSPIVESNAWLLNCDFDSNGSVFPDKPPSGPITWDYTYGSPVFAEATKVSFSKTMTTLEHVPDQDYVYTKVQVQALSQNGVWVNTPDALGAVLDVPWRAPDSQIQRDLRGACVTDVQKQFGSVP